MIHCNIWLLILGYGIILRNEPRKWLRVLIYLSVVTDLREHKIHLSLHIKKQQQKQQKQKDDDKKF